MSRGHVDREVPELPPLTPTERVLRSLVMTPRRLTSRWRVLPDFLILGAQRAGTTSLASHLARHPGVFTTAPKEVHFFDLHVGRGVDWYRAHFPMRRTCEAVRRRVGGVAVGEATPYYAFHPLAAERAHALVPDARLVFLARDPVDRAASHYHHELRWGFEDAPTFEAALGREEERLAGEETRLRAGSIAFSHAHNHHSYFARGLYARQLREWLAHFPRERLLVVGSEALFARPVEGMARVFAFLGLPDVALGEFPRLNALARPDIDADLRARLAERYRAHNAELYELAGEDLGWETER